MITEAKLEEMINQAKTSTKQRKFKQSIEMIIVFKDIDVKKGFALNEVVQLPKTSSPATVCIMATGDMGQKAKEAKADAVVGSEELDRFAANKRASRKFINKYDFFLADTQIMPVVGKVLGQLLGPRGKMPTPVPFNASIESFLQRFRASQILPLRKAFKGEVEFVCVKDKVAQKALEKLNIAGIKGISEELTGQCLFLFTNMSPFKLNVLLLKNKIMMAARGGDIASVDIVVPAKNTGIAPGPMLTEFKEAGIPTKIDQGTIWIQKDTTPVKKGEAINEKLAALLGKLDIKPVEAGISLYTALEEGLKYAAEEMIVDVAKIRNAFTQFHQEAISLSIEAAYVTAENINQILSKAAQSARSVSVESGFMTDETKEQILQKAHSQANALSTKAKDYTAS